MDQNLDNKIDFKEKLISIFKENKLKIILFLILIILIIFSLFLFKQNQVKKNKLISDKYIQAGLQLSKNKDEEARKIFEEIILAKNSFYSVLALNTIVEKKLIEDKKKILEYFQIVEQVIGSEEKKDLLEFKKALFLINNGNLKEGKELLQDLINKNSKLKLLAKELIDN